MGTITIGVDLAKCVFSTCRVGVSGRVLQRRDFKRDAFAAWLAQHPAGTVVAMEACSGAHHWARRCLEYGLVPRLMAAQFVRPFDGRRHFRRSPTAGGRQHHRQRRLKPKLHPVARGRLGSLDGASERYPLASAIGTPVSQVGVRAANGAGAFADR